MSFGGLFHRNACMMSSIVYIWLAFSLSVQTSGCQFSRASNKDGPPKWKYPNRQFALHFHPIIICHQVPGLYPHPWHFHKFNKKARAFPSLHFSSLSPHTPLSQLTSHLTFPRPKKTATFSLLFTTIISRERNSDYSSRERKFQSST